MMSSQEKWYWRDQGFEDIDVLKVDRTTVFKADFYDTPVVVKHALSEQADKGVVNAPAFNEAVRSELKHHHWVVPRLIEQGEWNGRPWVASAWLEGRTLGEIDPFSAVKDMDQYVDRVVELLLALDAMPRGGTCPFDDVTDPAAYTQKRIEATRAYAAPVVEAGYLDGTELEGAMRLLADLQPHLDFRYQHHDVLPWHMIDMGDGNIGLVDAEFGGWRVRFYDVAYLLCKVYTLLKDDALARDIRDRVRAAFGEQMTDSAFMYPLLFTVIREMSERLRAGDKAALQRMRGMILRLIDGDVDRMLHL